MLVSARSTPLVGGRRAVLRSSRLSQLRAAPDRIRALSNRLPGSAGSDQASKYDQPHPERSTGANSDSGSQCIGDSGE